MIQSISLGSFLTILSIWSCLFKDFPNIPCLKDASSRNTQRCLQPQNHPQKFPAPSGAVWNSTLWGVSVRASQGTRCSVVLWQSQPWPGHKNLPEFVCYLMQQSFFSFFSVNLFKKILSRWRFFVNAFEKVGIVSRTESIEDQRVGSVLCCCQLFSSVIRISFYECISLLC